MKTFGTLLLCLSFAALQAAANAEVDHAPYEALLKEHVDSNGLVDYAALKDDPRLERYLDRLAGADPAALPDDAARLALWINAYNAYTLKLVADHYPVESIRDIPGKGSLLRQFVKRSPWEIAFAEVNGLKYTLNEIEHEMVRKRFRDPRIHYALVCAARSCPPLRSEAYTAARLDAQLDDQARRFLRDPALNRFDLETKTARLSRIFDWYGGDFGDDRGELLRAIAPYAPETVSHALNEDPAEWRVEFLEYDWGLNSRSAVP